MGFTFAYFINSSQSKRLEECQSTIDAARNASVELNKQFNQIYNRLGILGIEGNEYAVACFQTLQRLTPNIMQVSKDLGIDCKQYDENGKPVMIEDEKTKQVNPIEILPEVIRIEE